MLRVFVKRKNSKSRMSTPTDTVSTEKWCQSEERIEKTKDDMQTA